VAEDAAAIRRLERRGAACWPSAEIERIGGWQLGFMAGVTRRANAVLPLDWTGALALEAAIEAAEDRYRARGQSPVFKLTEAALPADLSRALDARGYRAEGESDVLARPAADFPGTTGAHAVRLLEAPEPEWTAVSLAGRSPTDQAALAALAGRLAAPRIFGLVTIDGAAACAGFAALAGAWASIAGVHTLDAARRSGAARSLMAALARWSAAAGARTLFLQAEADNEAAARLYRRLDFARLYGYHYRVAPD
jgi:ribosomal protein S18 acetylase RimI-like enzyme